MPVNRILMTIFRRLLRWLKWTAIVCVVLFLGFIGLDKLLPLPDTQRDFSTLVVAKDGTPLRAFADKRGVWRYPVKLEDVSPRYIEALINYEDRWFWYHPGINPGAMLRAAWQSLRAGRIVSGGSTLTMQVARLIDPHRRSLGGKLKQMFRALQLEYHYSKRQILTMYLNLAPFGGPVEGVQAASYRYFGKPVKELSHSEAALLAVLPQSPSRLRPDRYPKRARRARDKVIRRLVRFRVWPKKILAEAVGEPVVAEANGSRMMAPLLARRLKQGRHKRGIQGGVITTTIDADLQAGLEQKLRAWQASLPDDSSTAVLVVDNRTLAVRAYIGSVDFFNRQRFGHVDMVRAIRSPGSTLKPFLYGFAIEQGLVHSKSLLVDVPQTVEGYRPGNFNGQYNGPVSVTRALQMSLNVPAVDLLQRYGIVRFVSRLRNGHLRLYIPQDKPNLSVILGGAGTSLESLVMAYAAFARGGLSGDLRFTVAQPSSDYRMLDKGAAWIIRTILEAQGRPGLPREGLDMSASRRVAWKTGTSYGYRDAWAIGVTDRYTIGVWVGRPDGTPMPGHYGAITAAPLLFDIVDSLPDRRLWAERPERPATVSKAVICWPLGTRLQRSSAGLCHQQHTAWILKGQVPPTLPDRTQKVWSGNRISYWINPKTGKRVMAGCRVSKRSRREAARWPASVEPWLSGRLRKLAALPAIDPACKGVTIQSTRSLKIDGVQNGATLHKPDSDNKPLSISIGVLGGEGNLYWLVNGKLATQSRVYQRVLLHFDQAGRYEITVADSRGQYDRVVVNVLK
jgi:penicillin-binding protein 1C